MKNILSLSFAILLSNSFADCQNNQNGFSLPQGPYLGQKPPGNTPEIFAPDVVSRKGYFEHSAAMFTPDGKEVYWSAKPDNQRYYQIYFMKMAEGAWTEPQIAGFCRESEYYQQFTMSPDGKLIFFTNGVTWQFVGSINGAWGLPNQVPSVLSAQGDINICSVTASGSVYFVKRPEFDVYVSGYSDGTYSIPEKLCSNINSNETRENSVYVAPDESYMILEATPDAATCELFISFRGEDGSWSERAKLPIPWGRFPSVSPDGKYLFFMTREGIYWVSTQIIEELRPVKQVNNGN